jgi:hypothetical protein
VPVTTRRHTQRDPMSDDLTNREANMKATRRGAFYPSRNDLRCLISSLSRRNHAAGARAASGRNIPRGLAPDYRLFVSERGVPL